MESIAIIGMGCRLPGAPDPEAFWRLLRDGVDAVTEVPPDRWDVDAFYHPEPGVPGKMVSRRGGFLDHIDLFDPQFFGLSPREAARMDPQQRLLLEVAWEALENAGLPADSLDNTRTGVFIGISGVDYAQIQFMYEEPARHIDAFSSTGFVHSIAANRLSYHFDLHGPSMAVDTACSSALTAAHLACQSLHCGESDLALVGGVNVIICPEVNIGFSLARMLSPEGRCKSFDAAADGYVRGEGCGVVVLKRLSDARRDGDRIIAVVRGSAVNQDGRTNGLTAPSRLAQQSVMSRAMSAAGITPDSYGYIEAHGTASLLGDSIELQAIASTIGERRAADAPCLLGSVKANIGHLEAASGMAGLIKVILCLEHGEVPPQLHLKNLNPQLLRDNTPLAIPTAPTPWPERGGTRVAGLNSFGFGGANAHLVLEEAPARASGRNPAERPVHLLTLSAKSESALQEMTRRLRASLRASPEDSLPDICHSANTGRKCFEHRLAVAASSVQQLDDRLAAFARRERVDGVSSRKILRNKRPGVVFVFAGAGTHGAEMGRELYATQPAFRESLNRCAEFVESPSRRLVTFLGPSSSRPASDCDDNPSRPLALFAIEYALTELWISWGIEPDLLMGQGMGEYVAACVAGIISLQDATQLAMARASLMLALPEDGMVAEVDVELSRLDSALRRCRGQGSLFLLDGSDRPFVSCERAAVQTVLGLLESEGWARRTWAASRASTPMSVGPIADAFKRVAGQVRRGPARLPLVSSSTGSLINSESDYDDNYLARQIDTGENAARAANILCGQSCELFVEIGPHRAFADVQRRVEEETGGLWLPSLKEGQGDWQTMLQSLGELFTRGRRVEWRQVEAGYERRRVSLPTYPFERSRYWLDPDPRSARRGEQVLLEHAVPPSEAGDDVAALSLEEILAAETSQRQQLLEQFLQREIAAVLKLTPSQLGADVPLETFGLDSIMAIEIKHKIESSLNLTLPMVSLLEGPSICSLAARMLDVLAGLPCATGGEQRDQADECPLLPQDINAADAQTILANIDWLSDEQVDALLTGHLPLHIAAAQQPLESSKRSPHRPPDKEQARNFSEEN